MITILSGSNKNRLSPGSEESNPLERTPLRMLPVAMPTAAPIAEPRKPMKMASRENRPKTLPPLIPMAFMSPISRVRSWTDMSSVFTMPNPAASSAMIAKELRIHTIPLITARNIPSWSSTVTPSMSSSASWDLMGPTSVLSLRLAVAVKYVLGISRGEPEVWYSYSFLFSSDEGMGLVDAPAREAWLMPETRTSKARVSPAALRMAIVTDLPTASSLESKPRGVTQEAGSRISSADRSGVSPASSCSPSASAGEPRLSWNFLPSGASR